MKKILNYTLISLIILSVVLSFSLVSCKTAATTETTAAETTAAQAGSSDIMARFVAEEIKPSYPTEKNPTTAKEDYVVGLVAYYFADNYCKWLMNEFQKYQKEQYPNITLKVVDGQGAVEPTIAVIEQFITEQVDAIILQPFDSNAFVPSVQKALAAGIPIINTNVPINDEGTTAFVSSDFYREGYAQGEYMGKIIEDGAEIAIVKGEPADASNNRRKGVEDSLITKRTDVKLVSEQIAHWRKEEALKIAEDWVLKFPNLKYILSQSDEMAMGVVEALRGANKIGEIQVAAIDGSAQGCVAVDKGEILVDIGSNVPLMAQLSLDVAIRILNGESFDKFIYLPTPAIDKSNVAEYLQMHKDAGNLEL